MSGINQPVGYAAHGRDHHHDRAFRRGGLDDGGGAGDARGVADRGTAKLHYAQQRHYGRLTAGVSANAFHSMAKTSKSGPLLFILTPYSLLHLPHSVLRAGYSTAGDPGFAVTQSRRTSCRFYNQKSGSAAEFVWAGIPKWNGSGYSGGQFPRRPFLGVPRRIAGCRPQTNAVRLWQRCPPAEGHCRDCQISEQGLRLRP